MIADNAEQILRAGGNLIMDTTVTDNMVRLAAAAKAGDSHVTFVGATITSNILRVISAGAGHVTFDVATSPVKK